MEYTVGIGLGIILIATFVKGSENEHKVHNIILYPDKHEWCNAMDIEMVITYPGCTPRNFNNKVCVGQCFSYTSPRTRPPNRVEDKLKYCDYCQPSNATWETIRLDCDTDRYTHYEQEVELIHECACDSCFVEPPNTAKGLIPSDNYIYEYDETLYQGDLTRIVQEKLQSEDVMQVENNEQERLIEFSLNQETLEQAAQIAANTRNEKNVGGGGSNTRGHNVHNNHQPQARVALNVHNPQSRQWVIDDPQNQNVS